MPGLLDERDRDDEADIPMAGMADIAFLLLVFFLVVTTIETDTGIGITLPPVLEDEEPPPIEERNILRVLVNAAGEVLVDEEPVSMEEVRGLVQEHVTNYGEDPNLSDHPDDAVVSIQTDAETQYDDYIDALDEVQMGYREIYNQIVRTNQLPDGSDAGLPQTWESYAEYRAELGPEDEDMVRDQIGLNISIAEPDF